MAPAPELADDVLDEGAAGAKNWIVKQQMYRVSPKMETFSTLL
jgi:hypothetical protein